MKTFTAIDLFSGCGGLSLGLEKAGFNITTAIEIDPLAAKTYKRNHPDTFVIQEDVSKISISNLRKITGLKKGGLDLLAGCPPCQGFSRIKRKNKKAFNDPRNNLILEFARLVRELRPKLVLLENVPGLAQDRRFRKFLKQLDETGYKYKWGILDAADFGVPQRRKRLIMMASRIGNVNLPKPLGSRKSVRQTIGFLPRPAISTDPLQKLLIHNTERIHNMIGMIPKDGGSRSALSKKYLLDCHIKTEGFRDVYGRMKWNDVSPTLTGGCFNPSKGRFLHPRQNRAITMREAALLQSFPTNYFFDSAAGLISNARLIGDALPPKFGEAQGLELKKVLMKARG